MTNQIPRRAVILVLFLAGLLPACGGSSDAPPAPAASDEARWIPLFNGRDLSGWTPKIAGRALGEDPRRTFRVEDGVLAVRYDGYAEFGGEFGHLFYAHAYSRYRMRVEYRFVGEQCPGAPGWAFRNSGIMVHGQPAESMGVDQEFPVSIEVQLLGDDGSGARPTANLCTPGTNVVRNGELITQHCTNSSAPTFPAGEWVTVEIEVLGGERIRHFVDGVLVLEYEAPQLDPSDPAAPALAAGGDLLLTGGTISLQAESHPVEFRRVELLLLEE
ncbi:MAG: DUF1080 domain-containing protein [Planctomycetota bacterium]